MWYIVTDNYTYSVFRAVTMSSKPSRVFSRWIEEVIAEPSGNECLPSTTELSRQFGLSPTSINRILKRFVAGGELTAIRGKGTFVTSRMAPAEKHVTLHSVTSSRTIAEALTEDIATGRLKRGDPLPSFKLLRNQFKTGHTTIRHAYRMLEKRGLVKRVGRSYWVGGMKSVRAFGARGTVVCFNFSEGDPSDMMAETEIREVFTAMEHELHAHRLTLHFEDCKRLDLFLRPGAWSGSDSAGMMISGITKTRFHDLFPRIEALGPALSRNGKRLLLCGAHYRRPKRTHFFCHGTIITSVVRTAAEACFSGGYEDIVLLLREREGNLSDMRFLIRFISESLVRNPKVRITFLIEPLGANDSPESILKRTPSFAKLGNFEYLEGLLSKYEPRTIDDLCGMISAGRDLDRLMAEAPRRAVWLTTKAAAACRVVQWLNDNRVRMPSEAAVLCFDEDVSLARRGIASCVPDRHTIGYLMAHALIGDIPIKKSRQGFLRTPAILCERCTMP